MNNNILELHRIASEMLKLQSMCSKSLKNFAAEIKRNATELDHLIKDDWIPCDEELPRPGQRVQMWDNHWRVGYFVGEVAGWQEDHDDYVEFIDFKDITHWKSIPKGPDKKP